MHCIHLEREYLTLLGPTSTPFVVGQPEPRWLDLSGYQDIVAFIDVKKVDNGQSMGLTIALQTAPIRDETLFMNVTAPLVIAAEGLAIAKMFKDTTSFPLSRWLRWQVALTSAPMIPWTVTFRIWIAASLIGSGDKVATETARRIPALVSSSALSPKVARAMSWRGAGSDNAASPRILRRNAPTR